MTSVAVIIPFYQRQPGILAGALESILAQTALDGVTVHIVDDGSPVAPDDDIAPARARLGPDRVILHRKPNGGPGAARNHALDRLQGADVVAFLDSDDRWTANHLANVQKAMALGADLYFSDHIREGEPRTRFATTQFRWETCPTRDGLRQFDGDLFSLLLYGAPVGTSTVAYRFSALPDLRFQEGWRAGEDVLFFMDIVKRAGTIVFSPDCEVSYGRGVNIFAGAAWGTTADLVRLCHVATFHTFVPQRFSLTATQAAWNRRWLNSLDRAFMLSFVSAFLHRQPQCLAAFGSYAAIRPGAASHLFGALCDTVAGMLKRRHSVSTEGKPG
jgi:succinoglycan biosynthesis protein ExoW